MLKRWILLLSCLLATHVRKQDANTVRVKGEVRQFIHEAEDFAVFLPPFYKSLEVACTHFDIQRDRAHQATGDAQATVALIQKMAALADQELPVDFDPFGPTL